MLEELKARRDELMKNGDAMAQQASRLQREMLANHGRIQELTAIIKRLEEPEKEDEPQ